MKKRLQNRWFSTISTKLSTWSAFVEHTPVTYGSWLAGITSLVVARFFIEHGFLDFESLSAPLLFTGFAHFFLSFLFTTLVFVFLIVWGVRVPLSSAAVVVLFGFTIVLFPPIIDTIIAQGGHFTIYYKLDGLTGWSDGHGLLYRYLTFFGDHPEFGVTYGMRIEMALATFFLSIFAFLKLKNLKKTVLFALAAYTLFFLLGTLPSWIALAVLGWEHGFLSVTGTDVAGFFLTPFSLWSQSPGDFLVTANLTVDLVYALLLVGLLVSQLWLLYPKLFYALVKNARFPQLFYHSGLVCVGMGLAWIFTGGRPELSFFNILAFFVLHIAVWSAWLASVVVNDVYDVRIDATTNAWRPLPSGVLSPAQYTAFGWTFFGISLLWAGIANYKAIGFLAAYQALAWLYSAPPLRLKRIPLVGTFFAAVAGLVLLLLGYVMVSPHEDMSGFPVFLGLYLVGVLTLVLAAKDFKDIEGDRADGVFTLPVVLGADWARIVIGGGIWLAYLFSVAIFHEPKLFVPSLFFGALSFWILLVAKSGPTGLIRFQTLAFWLFVTTFCYGVSLVWIMF